MEVIDIQLKEQCKVDFALVGKRFKDERELNKITREYLAEKTGYSVRHIQEVERGDQMPEADFALMCCKLYHRDLNYFYLDDDDFASDICLQRPELTVESLVKTMTKDGVSDLKRLIDIFQSFL